LVEKVRDRLENDPEMEVSFRDLKELSIAKANASREALTARGEASNITEERKVVTQEDYEDTIKAAKERLEALKKADIIDIDGDN
jgi:F0F1-type ATP synthase membrane subunit b/b'